MGIKAKGFFGSAKGGFKLGKSRPKVQGRFIRKKLNSDKNVKFAKKFFKSDRRTQRRYIRRKTNLLKRKAAEKALEGGKAVKTKFKKSITSKGFNPIKFITMIFVGWIINVLPKIVSTLKAWMKKLKPVFDTLKSWVKGVIDFFTMIGTKVMNFVATITGDNATVDAEKKKLQDANENLKGAFNKQKKGFDDLTNKAKGEEKNLKKDLDSAENKVNKELENKGVETTSSTGEAILPNSNPDPKLQRDEVKSTMVPYTIKKVPKKNRRGQTIGTKEVKIDKITGKVWTGNVNVSAKVNVNIEQSQSITPSPKNGNVNLKADSTTKNKVVTLDVPIERTPPKIQRDSGSSMTTKQSDPDSVNSSELLLTSIEK